jgi:hypothetical protein
VRDDVEALIAVLRRRSFDRVDEFVGTIAKVTKA